MDNNIQKVTEEIIEKAIDQIEVVLNEVEQLDAIIKENQIIDFIKEWRIVFSGSKSISPIDKFAEEEFNEQFIYLISRMNDKNKIKDRVVKISLDAIGELYKLWDINR